MAKVHIEKSEKTLRREKREQELGNIERRAREKEPTTRDLYEQNKIIIEMLNDITGKGRL